MRLCGQSPPYVLPCSVSSHVIFPTFRDNQSRGSRLVLQINDPNFSHNQPGVHRTGCHIKIDFYCNNLSCGPQTGLQSTDPNPSPVIPKLPSGSRVAKSPAVTIAGGDYSRRRITGNITGRSGGAAATQWRFPGGRLMVAGYDGSGKRWSETVARGRHTRRLRWMVVVIRPKRDHSFGKVDMNSDPRGLRTDGSRGDTKGCGIAQRYYQTSRKTLSVEQISQASILTM
ncbi:hypothetical protein F2Q68_00006366 [Brassica cretica]|uniref:Uncharacterized protein n=1 Tax=Brassica cretica TaxID=69181 RepID=A0A8S9J408_BRACR|nr:hypothetical protein F2Q68_00006366 [Brassica cretica]